VKGKLRGFGEKLGSGIDNISRGISWLSTTGVFLVFLVVVVDVIGRYFFNRPIKGSNDICELLLIPVAFFAMGFTQLMKDHVRVTLFYEKFSPKGKAIIDGLVFLIGAVIWAVVAWNMGVRGWKLILSPQTAPSSMILKIPHLPFICMVVVGSILFSLQLIVDSIRAFSRVKPT